MLVVLVGVSLMPREDSYSVDVTGITHVVLMSGGSSRMYFGRPWEKKM